MGQGRPTGATYGLASARIDLDLSSLTAAPRVAQAAGDATAKAIQQSLKIVQNEQKITLEQAKQATAAVQAQQAQITSTTRAESAERIAAARAEAAVTQQQAKAASTATIEEERRKTAAFKQELKERNRAQGQSQVSAGAFARGAVSFAGAAIGGPIGGLVGAAIGGNPAIAAGLAVNQVANFEIDAAKLATTYNRQEVAARSLAGSQGKLNDLMAAYDRASGGAIDKGTELAKVTALEATGFAKNAKDLEEFVTGTRGAALAMGKTQDFIGQETQLAIVNQSKRRLDQIGLGVDEVTQRVNALTKANKSLSAEQAFSQAVIGLQNEKFGALAKSAEGAASGMERLSKAWADFQLQQGQDSKDPINRATNWFADQFNNITEIRKTEAEMQRTGNTKLPADATPQQREAAFHVADQQFGDDMRNGIMGFLAELAYLKGYISKTRRDAQGLYSIRQPELLPSAANQSGNMSASPFAAPSRFKLEQEDLLVEWNTKRVAIERETQAAVASEARSWANQRLEAERAYTKASVREAEDWSRQQSRTIEDFQEGQSKNANDYAKQQAREERDLGRSIVQAQADDADKVADIRKDSAKRALDIEQDYADQRAKAARDHSDKLLDAAGALDAKAVYQEQRSYAEQAGDADKAHNKQVKDNKDQLQERLDDEAKSLRKSIDQQRTALSQREADQAEDYDQSNKDALAQFTKEQTRAVADRGVRLDRMATDQQDQLTAIDNAHKANMADIAQRTDDENKALKTQYDKLFTDAGIRVKGFVDTSVDDAIKAYDKYYTHMDDVLSGKIKPGDTSATGIAANRSGAGGSSGAYAPGSSRAMGTSPGNYTPGASPAGYAAGGWVQRGGMALVHTGEYVIPAARASSMASSAGNVGYSVVFQPGSIVVYEADDAERTVNLVIEKINTAFEQKRRAA